MQCTERPRDTERGDGSTSATGERTSSLWLPRLQHAVRALRQNRETDSERSPDWRSITRAPRTGFLRPFLTKARDRQTSVHREILIRPMTAVGHERRTRIRQWRRRMSASLRKRLDYCVTANGRDVPQAAVSNRSKAALIRSPSAEQQAGRNFMADRFCKLQIDDQLELGWLVDREIGRLCAAQPKPDSCAIPLTRISCEPVWE